MNFLRISLLSLCSIGLFACGGGARIADNREAAASAAFSASRGANSANGQLRAAAMQAITTNSTVDCPNGGTASVATSGTGIDTSGAITFDIAYANCSWDGATRMSGTVHFGMSFVTDGASSFSMALAMEGRVDFSGEISDFVQMDITETIDATRLSDTSGTVSVVLDGTITTSSNTYTYDNESIVVTADGIQSADS